MDEINSAFLGTVTTINLGSFFLLIMSATVMGLILMLHYNKYFPYVSRSQGMGKTLVAIAIITTIVITIVKSSLALSLGLVGALSIVRFRTPIKEPFELAYIFCSIAVGLALGANQLGIILIGLAVLLITLTLISTKSKDTKESMFFLYITSKQGISSSEVMNKITALSQKLNKPIDIRRLDKNLEETQITLNIRINSNNELLDLTDSLNLVFPDSEISIVDGQRLMPM